MLLLAPHIVSMELCCVYFPPVMWCHLRVLLAGSVRRITLSGNGMNDLGLFVLKRFNRSGAFRFLRFFSFSSCVELPALLPPKPLSYCHVVRPCSCMSVIVVQDDLVVSASLDQTVRVWDTTGLRKKTVRGAPSAMVSDPVILFAIRPEYL